MSTLVNIVMAIVIQIMYSGEIPKEHEVVSHVESIDCTYAVQQLNPQYIVTRDELLSQQNQ